MCSYGALIVLFSYDSVLVPEEGFLLGCVFAIADYPEQMSDKQLLATWKRVRCRGAGVALRVSAPGDAAPCPGCMRAPWTSSGLGRAPAGFRSLSCKGSAGVILPRGLSNSVVRARILCIMGVWESGQRLATWGRDLPLLCAGPSLHLQRRVLENPDCSEKGPRSASPGVDCSLYLSFCMVACKGNKKHTPSDNATCQS